MAVGYAVIFPTFSLSASASAPLHRRRGLERKLGLADRKSLIRVVPLLCWGISDLKEDEGGERRGSRSREPARERQGARATSAGLQESCSGSG